MICFIQVLHPLHIHNSLLVISDTFDSVSVQNMGLNFLRTQLHILFLKSPKHQFIRKNDFFPEYEWVISPPPLAWPTSDPVTPPSDVLS